MFSENGVSRLSTKITPEFADVTVTTEASIVSSIINIRVTSVKSSEITLSWEAPSANDGSESDGDPVETYEVLLTVVIIAASSGARNECSLQVLCFPKGDSGNASTVLTSELSATFSGLMQRTEYGIQVRAKTQRGWGAYSTPIYKTTGQVFKTGNKKLCMYYLLFCFYFRFTCK